MQGWIKLYRCIQENDFYLAERFCDALAWIDLLMLANHKAATIRIRRVEVNLKRGDLAWSIVSLAKRWRWNERTVKKFLRRLEKDSMIQCRFSPVTTVISICNYDFYQSTEQVAVQSTEHNTEQATGQDTEQKPSGVQTDKKGENVINDNTDKNHIYKAVVQNSDSPRSPNPGPSVGRTVQPEKRRGPYRVLPDKSPAFSKTPPVIGSESVDNGLGCMDQIQNAKKNQ